MLLPKDRGFIHRLPSEITPREVFEGRRLWLAGLGALAALGPRHALAQPAAKTPPLSGTRSSLPGAVTITPRS